MCSPTRLQTFKIPAGTPLAHLRAMVPRPPQAIARGPRPVRTVARNRSRRDFLLFVRVLIKCVQRSGNYKLTIQTKAMVAECVKRNRMGDPHFTPLQDSLELRLRGLVGPGYWYQAKDYVHCYQKAKAKSQQAAGVSTGAALLL